MKLFFNLDQWFMRRYLLKTAEWDHLCNFGRGCQVKQFFEIVLNLDQCFSRSVF